VKTRDLLDRWTAVLGLALVFAAAGLTGRVLGVHHLLFAVLLQALLMRWALWALHRTRPALNGRWFWVAGWEPQVYRALGVYRYQALLRVSGWERFRREAQGFDGSRASLPRYERSTREAEASHAVLALLCTGLILGAWRLHARDTATWLLLTSVFCHVYPVLLQRTLRARLQRLGVIGDASAGETLTAAQDR
jgi:Glycosyl-4,4'-diaponeurosporenoate acyltransferase